MVNFKRLSSVLTLQITSANCVAILNELNRQGITLNNVVQHDPLTTDFTIFRRDYMSVVALCNKKDAKLKIIKKTGLYWTGITLFNRPVLLGLLAVLLGLSIYLPGRVLFVSVEGNTTVPEKRIVEAAAKCGIRFGTVRRSVRSEVVKNALLQEIPQLQWAGINTFGCTAVISVRERTEAEVADANTGKVCSIIAMRDGIIQDCTVYRGNALCATGQAVKSGQVLVSGYMDYGIYTRATHASAEINALTHRQLEVISPKAVQHRGQKIRETTRVSLKLGKNIIKFYKDSGNSDPTCVKIYLEEYVHLPGGFRLPIAVIKERLLFYTNDTTCTDTDNANWLCESAKSYLQTEMLAGQVLSENTQQEIGDDMYYFWGKYVCIEMIGQVKYEQTILKDEQND